MDTPKIYRAPRPDATYQVHEALAQVFTTWSDRTDAHGRGTKPGPTGESRVREALALLAGALSKLGKRTGDRSDAARQWLEAQRARLSKSLAVWESIGRDGDGPAVTELAARIENAYEAEDFARAAFEDADPDEVRARRDDLDVATATLRKAGRDLAKLVADARLPAVIDPTMFVTAEESTKQLVLMARRGTPMTALHAALDQGANAKADEARLWIVSESSGPSELYTARAARYVEAHAAQPAAVAAE